MSAAAFAALAAGAVAVRRFRKHSPAPPTAFQGEKSGGEELPAAYLIVNAMSKKTNIGNIIRSCSAFGVRSVFVAGRKKDTSFYGSKGTKFKVPVRYFPSLAAVRKHCNAQDIAICGIEIMDEAQAVDSHPWNGPTAFLLGNEGTGLNQLEKEACDQFVYISHYGSGTASLNVTVAGSIVLHHFGLWAKYPERPRDGEKYIVEEARNAGVRDGEPLSLSEVDLEVRQERAEENRRAKEEAAAAMGGPLTATSLLGGAAKEGDGNW